MMQLRRKYHNIREMSATLGMRATAGYLRDRIIRRRLKYWIHPKLAVHPVCVRLKSSDINVFNHVFVDREYGSLDDMDNVSLIIDCGANVGYSAAYFLSQFKNCQLIAVEPDPGNFAMLQRNLTDYGNRVQLIRAGVWSCTAPLVIQKEKYRDGREWAKQVSLCGPDEEPDIEGVDIGTVLATSNHERISLLKMDIEGAEAVVFSKNYHDWLNKVDVIAIELHDDSSFGNASEVFFSAISGQGFKISRCGELTICRRPGLPTRST
jgi:FkbM family methyltransferase